MLLEDLNRKREVPQAAGPVLVDFWAHGAAPAG